MKERTVKIIVAQTRSKSYEDELSLNCTNSDLRKIHHPVSYHFFSGKIGRGNLRQGKTKESKYFNLMVASI